jgi:hypothetical protein
VAGDFDIKQMHLRALDRAFENPNNLAEELEVWAMGVMQEYPYSPGGEKHQNLISNVSYSLASGFEKLKGAPPLEMIRALTDLYCSGGPFEDREFNVKLSTRSSPELLGMLYFIASTGFTGVSEQTRNRAVKVVVELAFEDKKKWRELSKVLQVIDQANPGYGLLVGIPDLLMNLEQHMVDESDAVFMQGAGGIERIKAVGADLDKVTASVLRSVTETEMNNAGLPVVLEFVKASNEDLKASGQITQAKVAERYNLVLEAVLHVLRQRPKNLKQDCWKPMLDTLAPYATPETSTGLVLHLARINGPKNLGMSQETLRSKLIPEDFKKDLRKLIDTSKQYDLVMELGIADLFTDQEINKIKGLKLESALGM